MTPKQMQLKWSLEHSRRINDFTGTLAVRYTEIPVVECARRVIAHTLFKQRLLDFEESMERASIFLVESEVILLENPTDENDTLPLLQNNQIDYPDFYSGLRHIQGLPLHNTLRHLFCIWTVKGYHKQDPDTLVEMLIGGYSTLPPLAPLGRRSGYQWISPTYPRIQ